MLSGRARDFYETMTKTCIGICAALTVLCVRDAHAQGGSLGGITFVVDTSPELTPQGLGPVRSLGLRVSYAGSRGRVDVLARPQRPSVAVGAAVAAQSIAQPGDYYLFDSTGFILVRPATKQFASFHLAEEAFNYEARRDGWPAFFRMGPLQVDTIRDATAESLKQHGEQRIFWHVDLTKDSLCGLGDCSVKELARGRTTVTDAPGAEVFVVRWFGPARALAGLPGGVVEILAKPVRVTSVNALLGVHRLVDLEALTIDPKRLTLPADYTESGWPGFPEVNTRSRDGGAKWRVAPE